VEDGAYRQTRRGMGLSYFGDENWSDYTLTLKARKFSGNEGFLIAFGRKGGDRYWWNLGGWGNTQDAIEFNQNVVGSQVTGTIETNRWYDIKIELAGSRIKCSLDGKLIHDETAKPGSNLFAVAGRDDMNGDIVIKVINLSSQPYSTTLNIAGVNRIAPHAQLTVLTSDRLSDNNSLENPKLVVPVTSDTLIPALKFTREFPANSFNVLRLKTDKPERLPGKL
jgi:alpha-L-arabinofuranosidase